MLIDFVNLKGIETSDILVFLLVGLVVFKVMSIKTVVEVTMLKEIIITLILTIDFVNMKFSLCLKGEIKRREKN